MVGETVMTLLRLSDTNTTRRSATEVLEGGGSGCDASESLRRSLRSDEESERLLGAWSMVEWTLGAERAVAKARAARGESGVAGSETDDRLDHEVPDEEVEDSRLVGEMPPLEPESESDEGDGDGDDESDELGDGCCCGGGDEDEPELELDDADSEMSGTMAMLGSVLVLDDKLPECEAADASCSEVEEVDCEPCFCGRRMRRAGELELVARAVVPGDGGATEACVGDASVSVSACVTLARGCGANMAATAGTGAVSGSVACGDARKSER